MTSIDKAFFTLADEIRSLDEKELYYRMRKSFDAVPESARRGLMTFFSQYPYWGKLDIDRGEYEEIALKQQALSQHMDDFAWLYGRLGDYRSKKTLYAILSNWYRYDFISTAQAKEYLFSSYFDLDLLSCGENEVIVDLGAYIGDTVLSYIEHYGEDRYKKFYCYEMTPETFEQLKRNLAGYRDIDLRQKGVSDVEGFMSLTANAASSSANTLCDEAGGEIPVTTLDADIQEPVTLIKADIEGHEQRALLGAKDHILNDHPRLLISVYHNNEDLWKIPRMIHDWCGDYRFYLRFQSSVIYPTEITLFAL